jgi:hypothetical protein
MVEAAAGARWHTRRRCESAERENQGDEYLALQTSHQCSPLYRVVFVDTARFALAA